MIKWSLEDLSRHCAAQGEEEMKRCCDAAAAEVQAILQGQRIPKGGVYQPPSQRPYNAVGPPAQVRCEFHECEQ
jgi:hypothetical protein